MRNARIVKTIAVVVLLLLTAPGCDYTSTQITNLLTGSDGLATLAVEGIWNSVVTPALNPQDDPTRQAIINTAETAAQNAVANQINRNIPVTPGT